MLVCITRPDATVDTPENTRYRMKKKLLTIIFVVLGFYIIDATDREQLQEFMENTLEIVQSVAVLESAAQGPKLNSSSDGNVPVSPSIPSSYTRPSLTPRPRICPKEVKISWQLRPPYTLERNDTDNQTNVGGIFHQALDFALDTCCAFYGERKPALQYLAVSSSSSSLLRNNKDVTLVYPIHKDRYIGHNRIYVNIIDSPGVVLIQKNPSYIIERGGHLFKAILAAWPIVVLSILMSCLSGICIWMLDSRTNAKEFGSTSYQGAFDGFWWAFVTMSTVGYGDKTPKSTIARLFSVLWIMIGITMCSILTATLSSALTSVKVERYDFTTGKTFAVQRDSFAFKRAVNLGLNVTDFENLYDEAYDMFKHGKVDGILEETFAGFEFVKRKGASAGLTIVQVFEGKHGYGVAVNKVGINKLVFNCLQRLIEFVSDEILFNASRLLKSNTETASKKHMAPAETEESGRSIFHPESTSFQVTVLGMSVAVFVFMICSLGLACLKWLRRKRSNDLEAGKK